MSYKLEKPYTEKQRFDFIIKYNHNKGLLIEETKDVLYALEPNEIMLDGIPVIDVNYESDKLKLEKELKLQLALDKAYKAEEQGTVMFKDAVFETTATNVSKLTSQFYMLQTGFIDSVQWLSKDDVQVELNASEVLELMQLIAEYTGALWNVQYLCMKERILDAKDLNELNEIVVEY